MQNKYITLLLLLFPILANSQQLIDFENQLSELDTFINGQSGEDQFIIESVLFPIDYDHQNDFWAGQWAVSSSRNNTTGNFLNLYGCIDGEGTAGSDIYAVGQKPVYGGSLYISSSSPIMPENVHITNTTYAYNVIRDGNQFSKAFGGPSGDDPDYFYIEWNGFLDGELQGSEKFYLADYRYSNNNNDYIINQWTEFDLSSLGMVDRIEIEFYSTDTGEFGINTPTFFAIDNFEYQTSSSSDVSVNQEMYLFPNPTVNQISWKGNVLMDEVQILDLTGKLMLSDKKIQKLDLGDLPSGTYLVKWKNGKVSGTNKLIKQ